MNSSLKMTNHALSISQFAILMAIAFIIGLLITHVGTSFERVYWSGNALEVLDNNGQWQPSDRSDIGDEPKVQTIRFFVEIDESDRWLQPIGLQVGGPFSAEIYWDGEQIGEKGKTGINDTQEVAGPIDVIAYVPSRLLMPGRHEIRLTLSTQHLLRQDDSVVRLVQLAPYREDDRRQLRYYAAPLVILSALIALTFQNVRIGLSAGSSIHLGLAIFGLFMVFGLIAEVSRALISYAYQYHELRGLIIWISNIIVGLSLIYTCYKTTPALWAKAILGLSILSVAISYFLPINSGDVRLAQDFMLLTAGPAIVCLILALKKQVNFLSILPLFWLACFVSTSLSIGLFLDSFQFIAALILLLGSWMWTYVEATPQSDNSSAILSAKRFEIKSAGKEKFIDVSDTYALKSEGNFTLVFKTDGTHILHQDGLGEVLRTNPQGYLRVHRSYAVNTQYILSLRSAEGSKYWLELKNGETIPVSRYRVAELRSTMAG